jgi:predicted glycogen debranching enzyme
MIELGKQIVTDLSAAASREWLETNGIGGYASGTVSGIHTRRYHGLLVAATRPPLGRAVMLSKVEETLIVDGVKHELSANRYPGKVHPTGFEYLTSFRLDPFPVWTFNVDGVELEKKLFMIYGSNSTGVSWTIASERDVRLDLRPLVAFRDHHQIRRASDGLKPKTRFDDGVVHIDPGTDLPALHLISNCDSVLETGDWYYNFEYAVEEERGFDFREDLFQPCELGFDLSRAATLIASTELDAPDDVETLERAEIRRRAAVVAKTKSKTPFLHQLASAADQFIVKRGAGSTVIAGYHWFSDWGRDTMIALPGLTLSTNRPDVAKSILAEFAKHISEGMVPNRFPDVGEVPEYNTVDATLWFFEAICAYLRKTEDHDFVRETLYPKLIDIVDWHVRGTRHNIHVDTDGLLCAGEPGVQLTWMDAKVGEHVVTPRSGKAVEIQALWYNALRIMTDLAAAYDDGRNSNKFSGMADVARASFSGQFWNEEAGCLFDVVDGDERDASVRPNQIFAVSLHHAILDGESARKVVDKVENELLTPFGLRTLSPADPRYVPVYIGSPFDRDSSYHQGTVWVWLMGPFVDAYRKVHGGEPGLESKIAEFTAGFTAHLREAMIGQVSEIFDADPPHAPRGAAAQAWSVGELLRILAN